MIACLVAAPWPYPTARNAPGAEERSLLSNTNSTRHILRHSPDTEPYPSCARDKSYSACQRNESLPQRCNLDQNKSVRSQFAPISSPTASRTFSSVIGLETTKFRMHFKRQAMDAVFPQSQFRGGMAKLRGLRTTLFV